MESNDLSISCRTRLDAVFRSIDKDNSGTITEGELAEACQLLSMSLSEEDIRAFSSSDINRDGVLNYDEFCDFVKTRLFTTFSSFDKDSNGDITVHELRSAFGQIGYNPTEREVNTLIAKVDTNRDGVVSFNEFCDYFSSLPSPSMRLVVEQWASGLSVDIGTDLAPPSLPPPSISIWHALFAGGMAGIVSRTATAPLEKIKLLAQTSTSASRLRIISSMRDIIMNEKWIGLFSGNGTNCLRVFPFSGLVCVAYSSMAKHFPIDGGSTISSGVSRMMAGACAGIFATTLTHPLDVIRARLTVQVKPQDRFFNTFATIVQSQGIRGLYRGLTPTLAAIGPFIGVQQSTYDLLKHWFTKRGTNTTTLLLLTCGSAAGIMAQTVVYPLDVVRRQMQVHAHFKSPVSVAKDMILNRQLFAGLLATYLKVMPSVAISLLVRDALLGRLK